MDANGFRNVCAILLNLDLDQLEAAGVITPGAKGGSDWTRFNKEPLIFVLKLPTERREALWALVQDRLRPAPQHCHAEFLFMDGEDRAGECNAVDLRPLHGERLHDSL